MRKHILVLGGNDSSSVKAAQLDVDVTLFQLRRLLTQAQIDAVTRLFVFDFEQIDEALALAKTIHTNHPFHAVVSFWERGLLPAALIGEALGIATNPSSSVRLTRDKLAMRTMLERKGINGVRFSACDSSTELSRFLGQLGRKVILKPTNGSGSAGVSLVSSLKEVGAAWNWAVSSGLTPLMAEEYIDGPEYSVESLSVNGVHHVLGVTEKFTTGPPHCIETGHCFPAVLPPAISRQITEKVVQLLTCAGHQIGPAHTEVRLFGKKPVVIETQTRFGGDQIWEMVEMVTGVDLTRTTCAYLLGLKPPPVEPKYGGAAIRFFAYENCEIMSVTGIEHAQSHAGVLRVHCTLRSGTSLGPLLASTARQGYVLAAGRSATEARKRAAEAEADVQVELRPHGRRSAQRAASKSHLPQTASGRQVRRLLDGVRLDEKSFEGMLSLTANENLPSRSCRLLLVSPLGDRYHLGTPFERLPSQVLIKGRLMLKGLPRVCALEQAAHEAAREMFKAEVSDFRPLSGVHTTLCTISLCTRPGDTVYSIPPDHGGHFATRAMLERIGRRSRYLSWNNETFSWASDILEDDFRGALPAAILLDSGAVLKPLPVSALRAAVGHRVRIIYDASHTLGLIAGGVFPNPLREGCDVLQGNTHKTFPGPQKGMLHFRRRRFGAAVCGGLSRGFISSQHTHHALALYLAMLEMQAYGKDYARQMVENAVALGTALEKRGFELLRAGAAPTESNMIIIKRAGACDAFTACDVLMRSGVLTNARTLHGCKVLRLGTQEVTRRGMRETAMEWIADLLYRALFCGQQLEILRREVADFVSSYRNVHYSFDQELGLWT